MEIEKGSPLDSNHDSDLYYRILVENSMVGVYIIQDDKIQYVNPRGAEIFGYEPGEVIGLLVEDFIIDEEKERTRINIRTRIQGEKESIHYETIGRKKTGELIYIDVYGSTIIYKERPAIIGSMIDVTEREIAKQQLLKEKNLLESITNSLPGPFSLFGQDGKFRRWNRRFEIISGFSPEEILEMTPSDLFEGADKEKIQKAIEQTFNERPTVVEATVISKQKRRTPYVFSPSLIEYDGILCIISQGFDISTRKKNEEKLIRSEANLHMIFNASDTGFILLDNKFHIVSFNQEAADMIDREFGVNLKRKANIIPFLSDDQTELKTFMNEVIKGEQFNYERSFIRTDGTTHWYSIKMFPVRNTQKEIFGLMISLSDITETKNNEIIQQQRNKNLEQFSYIVAHNLRGPIARILGISEVLNGPSISHEEHTELEHFLFDAVNQLDETIKDLSHILEIKKGIRDKEVVNFSQLVEEIKMSIQDVFEKENVRITTDFSAVDEMNTTHSYLKSVFYNLISNSVKYKQPGKEQVIEIRSEKNNDDIKLFFKDKGLGIDLKTKGDEVFGLYNRFHQHIEGKGLGLFMVKTQVELLGGSIQIKSEPNVGTEFIIEFKEIV
ncbi:PAS domain S-box protein [Solitalea sp. MAHUQ-68]|uniref:histidine kinase n=1 Tax=Solitalea agri TaxID=2953739 RepID=A0A9X2F5E3_9SPHI|nr:PAS domain S-box protein [Solitalea agri]MCO4294555.1 PAS domain S-box protein [Solitalea agri]